MPNNPSKIDTSPEAVEALARQLMNYDSCSDEDVDKAAAMLRALVEERRRRTEQRDAARAALKEATFDRALFERLERTEAVLEQARLLRAKWRYVPEGILLDFATALDAALVEGARRMQEAASERVEDAWERAIEGRSRWGASDVVGHEYREDVGLAIRALKPEEVVRDG